MFGMAGSLIFASARVARTNVGIDARKGACGPSWLYRYPPRIWDGIAAIREKTLNIAIILPRVS